MTTPLVSEAAGGSDDTEVPVLEPSLWPWRDRLVAYGFAAGITCLAVVSAVAAGMRLHRDELGASWQLLDITELARDPFGSTWYLHIQPPVHNLLVGSVLRWSPFPGTGTLLVLYALTLVGTAVLLADILLRWRVRPAPAGVVAGLALCNPNLLSTIGVATYDVPVAFFLTGAVWWLQRYLVRPEPIRLVALAVWLTTLAMTRSLFHPMLVVAIVGLAAVARKAAWRHVLVAVAVPVVVVGGWMLKNAVLFDTATTSSWLGFNLQRGVVATMERDQVTGAVEDGTATFLAVERPFRSLDAYEPWVGDCTPAHDHPVVADEERSAAGGLPAPNFNHECYLPLYEESQRNAVALVRRYPGRYLWSRVPVVVSSFSHGNVGGGRSAFRAPGRTVERTWMDQAFDVVLLPVDLEFSTGDWNLPLFGDELRFRVSLTLMGLYLGVVLRGTAAVVLVARTGWRDRRTSWRTEEVLWVLLGGLALYAVVGAAFLEFGENGRFRSVLDPLLIAVPVGALFRVRGQDRHGARQALEASDPTILVPAPPQR